MRKDARDKWACQTFPNRFASELKADLRDEIQEKRISTEEQCLDWLEQMLQTKSWTIFGQYPSAWSVEDCG